MIAFILSALYFALTDPQVDHLLRLLEQMFETIKEGISTLWVTLSPVLLGYLAYRQSINRREVTKEIKTNTEVSEKAFEKANNHNAKIEDSVALSHAVLKKIEEAPIKVEVVNPPTDPANVTDVK